MSDVVHAGYGRGYYAGRASWGMAEFGPDGALYIIDWHEPLIGHMQYSIRDPQRDKTHGRIYRITYPALPLLKVA